MWNMEAVAQYLKDAHVFYLSTVDGDRPRTRPLGLSISANGKVYFGVGDFKDVYKQMVKNPKVELVACKDGGWLRMYGTAVFEQDFALAEAALNAAPHLRKIYNDETGYKMMMFHIEDGAAELHGIMDIKDSFEI